MKLLKIKSVASVELADIETSIDELEVLENAVNFAIKQLSNTEIERIFGATKDELEGIVEDLEHAISDCKALNPEPAFA
jgi:anti-sigma regulatory factor (Ser/Thr protein kinase)